MKAADIPAAMQQEIEAMFVDVATRVGFAYVASLAILAVLMQVVA